MGQACIEFVNYIRAAMTLQRQNLIICHSSALQYKKVVSGAQVCKITNTTKFT